MELLGRAARLLAYLVIFKTAANMCDKYIRDVVHEEVASKRGN